jgi:soluble lytic murein transglycosylase
MRKLIAPLIIGFVLFMGLFYFDIPWNLVRPIFHQDTVERYSALYHMDPLFVTAVIRAESHFLWNARSNRGAVGLMQLMPATAREIAIDLALPNFSDKELAKPEMNIQLGVYYLNKLSREFDGNLPLTAAAYNAGLAKVQLWYRQNPLLIHEINDIPYEETREYVNRVMRTYQWLKHLQKVKRALQKKGV